jgi:hypothetical protein
MRERLLIACASVAVLAALAIGWYAIRARESAINGWSAWSTEHTARQIAETDLEIAKTDLEKNRRLISDHNDAFRWLLAEKAGIKDADSDMQIAEKLTRHIYTETPFTNPYIETTNDPLRYFLTVNKKTFNYCSSLSMTLEWALDLFDVKSRIVNVAAKNFFTDKKGDTHTFIEAMIDGRPIVFDPTFSTTYTCGKSNRPADAKTMFECVKEGQSIRPTYLSTPRPGRSLAEYYITLEELFYAIDAVRGEDFGFYQFESPEPQWLRRLQRQYADISKMKARAQ